VLLAPLCHRREHRRGGTGATSNPVDYNRQLELSKEIVIQNVEAPSGCAGQVYAMRWLPTQCLESCVLISSFVSAVPQNKSVSEESSCQD
jgi:hypothetical protein